MSTAGMLGTYRRLLEPAARRQFHLLCGLALVAGFMESASVASIMPFLAALASPDLAFAGARLSRLLEWLGTDAPARALAYLGGIVLGVLVLSNALSAAVSWRMLRFANRQGQDLSTRLLASYLAKPYAFYLHRHTAELQKNLFAEVNRVTGGILVPAAQVVAKLSALAFISLLLLLVSPAVALAVAGVLGITYALLYRISRSALHRAGLASVEAATERAKQSLDALGGVKEIKLLGREADFAERFREPSRRFADAQSLAQAITLLPRYAVETVAFGLILGIAVFLLGAGQGVGELLPLLGLFAYAGYRMMPALQQVFAGFAAMRNSQGALQAVIADLQEASPASGDAGRAPLPLRSEIELAGVSFRYPGEARWELPPVDLRIPRNSSVALVGATGCGKTTVVDLLMGLLTPSAGSLRVDGTEVTGRNVRDWQRNIGHVPQQIFLCDDSIARNIALGLPDEAIDMGRVERAARMARLHDFVVGELPKGYETAVGERGIRLSGGQRQRIGIARALYTDPDLLVLDEATSALDNATESALFEALQALAGRKTVVMVAHRLSTVRGCDLICLMDAGRIVERGRYEDLMRTSSRFRALAVG